MKYIYHKTSTYSHVVKLIFWGNHVNLGPDLALNVVNVVFDPCLYSIQQLGKVRVQTILINIGDEVAVFRDSKVISLFQHI